MPDFIWILILIILGTIMLVLFFPVRLRIDTDAGRVYAGWPGLLGAKIIKDDAKGIGVELRFLFIRRTFFPFEGEWGKKEFRARKLHRKRSVGLLKLNRIRFLARTSWHYIRRSKLKKLYLDIDTEDVVVNAYLFPIFAMCSISPEIDLNVNYSGHFCLVVDVRNNLLTLIRVMISNTVNR
jgi:hypothetical protein